MAASKTKEREHVANSNDSKVNKDSSSKPGKNGIARASKAEAKTKSPKKDSKKQSGKNGSKPSLIQRAKDYFKGVRSEMKRVVWPSKDDLVKYTIAVLVMLLFFGVLIAIADSAIVPILYAFSGLRG